MRKLLSTLLKSACLLVALISQSGCHSAVVAEEPVPLVDAIELDTLHWNIGALEATTSLVLEDGEPVARTTVTNATEADLWWTGMRIYSHSSFGRSEGEFSGGWGRSSSQACRVSSGLPEIQSGTVQMAPEETRTYEDRHPSFPSPPKRETVTRWAFSGQTALPSEEPFEEWPPFQLDFSFEWDEDDGCSVETELDGGAVLGHVILEGAVPAPIRAPLGEAMQEACGESEFVSRRWLVGSEGGLANCVISLHPLKGLEVPAVEPVEDAVFEKVGPYYQPQVLAVTCGTEVTLRNQVSPCGGFHGRARKNRSFNRVIPSGEEHAWIAEHREVVQVGCDVQPYTHGAIVIVDTPYYSKTDEEGYFHIRDILPGTYRLRAFHEGLGSWIKGREVEVEDWGGVVRLELRTSENP